MTGTRFVRFALAGVASLGLIVPKPTCAAESLGAQVRYSSSVDSNVDVALNKAGELAGQVVDGAGHPIADAPVSVVTGGQEVANVRTDAQGHFVVRDLRGGVYMVSAAGNTTPYRLWTTQTAPPVVQRGQVLIVANQQVERGQYFGRNRAGALVMLGLLGGIVAAGVIKANSSSGS